MPTELAGRFSRRQWKDCCGKGCKKCEIAQTYIGEYGKKKGLALLNDDRDAVKKGKALTKAIKDGTGKKAGAATGKKGKDGGGKKVRDGGGKKAKDAGGKKKAAAQTKS